MEEKRSFGEYLRKKRLEMALTQKDLAQRLYVTESTVSKWERGLSYPDVSLVTAICGVLGISEHEFFAACDDDQAHAQEKAARRWRKTVVGLQRFFGVSYLIAIAVCFVCNIAIYQTLDWFWIVLTAIGLGTCFTNLPFLVKKNRLPICLGAATVCLLLLLISCWSYVGGHWLGGGLCITAVSLALPWGIWAIWRFNGKRVVLLSACLTSLWVFLLLAVIWAFAGGEWLIELAYPLAVVGVAFGWGYLGCVLWLPAGRVLKAGGAALLTSFAIPVFNSLCVRLLGEGSGPRFWDYFSFSALLARQRAGDLSWVNILIFLLLLLFSLCLTAFGFWLEVRQRKDGEQ
ncbi:MAG: helix-turn-helix transcriptional regulator [Oscillospiraceae bacterium]|jgi:transcriptional regulator with XRE-family HTH domain|nr:helix-turn-helix transcriptional regulator [Oscillospiraceae bacterium]